ncbi:MAG: PQQ-binding-like beta-propeller repeat protein [Candidatus Aminicenantes bacterium]|nr:PQQ-binding-like beta-propeller repeat protein [Candidatus Aminicenantes bacterium]
MKKVLVFGLVVLALSCSLFRAKPAAYPAGVMFPVKEARRIEFDGRPIGGLEKDEADRVYFSTDKGYLCCLDTGAQEMAWEFRDSVPFGCPPALGPERLFVWDEENSVICLDKKGALLWKVKVSEKISSEISQDRGSIYFGTETGHLLAMSQAAGDLLWTFKTEGPIHAAPAFFENQICLAGGDGRVYMISSSGRLRGTMDVGSPILVTPLVDGRRLYVGCEDRSFHCYDLRRQKRKWKITAGGRLLATPRADRKRVYFPASNGVLYALNKKNGHILWWWISPSKSRYDLEFDGQNILATSSAPNLHALDVKSGKSIGQFDAGQEIRSNPVWAEPYLLIALFDPLADKGRVLFLRKEVGIKLAASPASPQPMGTEVSFTALAEGFHRPQYEFSLVRGEDTAVVQPASERATWVWYTDQEGTFLVRVKVVDEKQSQEAEIPYEIIKNDQPAVDPKRSAGR